jgi:uncharacterized protein (DUF2237 family)
MPCPCFHGPAVKNKEQLGWNVVCSRLTVVVAKQRRTVGERLKLTREVQNNRRFPLKPKVEFWFGPATGGKDQKR